MSRFLDGLKKYATVINANFEHKRASNTDSAVKGSQNEKVVADFLRDYVPNWSISKNVQVLDADDQISDEVDICVCNHEQVFRDPEGGLFIAEGVDFVVQVKAILNSSELERINKNCRSIKQLKRQFAGGDNLVAPTGIPNDLIPRIPYIIFAFTTSLKADAIHEKLEATAQNIPYEYQPDSLFVLDPGITFLNFRDGSGRAWKASNRPIVGWMRLDSGEMTLVEMLRFINTWVPRFNRRKSPLPHYFPEKLDYPVIRGRTK